MECGGLPPLCRLNGSQSGARAPHSKAAAPRCRSPLPGLTPFSAFRSLAVAACQRAVAVHSAIRNALAPLRSRLASGPLPFIPQSAMRSLPCGRGSPAARCRLPFVPHSEFRIQLDGHNTRHYCTRQAAKGRSEVMRPGRLGPCLRGNVRPEVEGRSERRVCRRNSGRPNVRVVACVPENTCYHIGVLFLPAAKSPPVAARRPPADKARKRVSCPKGET